MSLPIGIVHERFTELAGSEFVVEQLAREFTDSFVAAAIKRPEGIPAGMNPQAGLLDKLYGLSGRGTYAPLLPMMPMAFSRMKLPEARAIITSHHAFANNVVHATDAPVISYVHSPARWAWDAELRAGEGGGPLGSAVLTALSAVARREELRSAPLLHTVVANSTAVAERISQWWGRHDSVVVHPPVDVDGFTPDPSVERDDFFLFTGRMVPWKRVDIAVRAAAEADVPLVVVGDGRSLAQCRALAGPKTTFLGRIPHGEQLLSLHRRARALLMPGPEDFGIVPVESMATGTPVIALAEAGALDTIRHGETGVLIDSGTDDQLVERFAAQMKSFSNSDFDPTVIRNWAQEFSRPVFRSRMRKVVDGVV